MKRELSSRDVVNSIAPWRPHVETSAGGSSPSSGSSAGNLVSGDVGAEPASPGASLQREANLQRAADALHSYIVEFTDYDHRRTELILARVLHVLHTQLDPSGQAGEAG